MEDKNPENPGGPEPLGSEPQGRRPAEGQVPEAPKTRGSMSAENQPIEERQVERATFEARIKQEAERARQEGRPLPMGGGMETGEREFRRKELSLEEAMRLESLERERFRRVERANIDELEYYSPEQVKLLFLRKAGTALVQLQEYGKPPEDFRWISQNELRELRKVIETLEEIPTFKPEERIQRGYPIIKVENLVRMGAFPLQDLIRIDRLLRARRELKETVILSEREERSQERIETEIKEILKGLGRTGEDREAIIGEFEEEINNRVGETIKEEFPKRAQELRELDGLITGFNHVYESYGFVQKPLSVSARQYHDILEKTGGLYPTGKDYKALFEAPSLLSKTPPLGGISGEATRLWMDILEDNQKNPFNKPPSAENRKAAIDLVKREIYQNEEFKEMLDENDPLHDYLVETAARMGLLFVFHWDMHTSHAVRVKENGEASLEVTYSDASKLHFPGLRSINEAKDFGVQFGNPRFSAFAPRLADDFLRVVSPLLESEDGKIRKRISLWDLVTKYGLKFKDIPWLGEELNIGLDKPVDEKNLQGRISLETRKKLQEIKHEGKEIRWAKVTDAREDALNVPYFLFINYLGKYYDYLTTDKFLEVIEKMTQTEFWESLNKPLDLGFDIFLSGRGLNKETIFKLKLLAKINLVASITAAVSQKMQVTDRESIKVAQGLGGYVTSIQLTVFGPSQFLKRHLEKVQFEPNGAVYEVRLPYAPNNIENLLNDLINNEKRGVFPGDKIIKGLFTTDEIEAIETSNLYYPFHIDPSKAEETGRPFILRAVEDAIQKPSPRP